MFYVRRDEILILIIYYMCQCLSISEGNLPSNHISHHKSSASTYGGFKSSGVDSIQQYLCGGMAENI